MWQLTGGRLPFHLPAIHEYRPVIEDHQDSIEIKFGDNDCFISIFKDDRSCMILTRVNQGIERLKGVASLVENGYESHWRLDCLQHPSFWLEISKE
jgi:hypothetical protein